jgi:hypothetical protein
MNESPGRVLFILILAVTAVVAVVWGITGSVRDDRPNVGPATIYIQNDSKESLTVAAEIEGERYPRPRREIAARSVVRLTFGVAPRVLFLAGTSPDRSIKIELARGGLSGRSLLIVSELEPSWEDPDRPTPSNGERTIQARFSGIRIVNGHPYPVRFELASVNAIDVIPASAEARPLTFHRGANRVDIAIREGGPSFRLYFFDEFTPGMTITLPSEPLVLPTPRPLESGLCVFLADGCPEN